MGQPVGPPAHGSPHALIAGIFENRMAVNSDASKHEMSFEYLQTGLLGDLGFCRVPILSL